MDALKLLLRFAAIRVKKPAVSLLVTDVTEELIVAFLVDLEQVRGNSIQTRQPPARRHPPTSLSTSERGSHRYSDIATRS